jgi:transposase
MSTPTTTPPPLDLEHLPDDPVLLRQMIAELLATLHATQRHNAQLQHRLEQLLKRLYGPRAERYHPDQPLLFAELLAEPTTASADHTPPAEAPPTTSKNKARPHGRRPLPENLPRQRVVHELSAAERACPECGAERQPFGEDLSEQLDWQPASLFVVQHVRLKYACPCCQGQVTEAPKPPQPIAKGLPGCGLLAQLIVSKYDDHLPLHRLERIMARQGLLLPRSTTCSWMKHCADLLTPLYDLLGARVLTSLVVHTDDTKLPVLDGNRDSTRGGHLWAYLGDRHHPYTVFDFTPHHTRDGPHQFLGTYQGYLQADAYSGYDPLYRAQGGVLDEVACWAHARRYFYDARSSDARRAHEALARIKQLYQIEADAGQRIVQDKLSAAQAEALRWQCRQEQAVPLLASLHTWLREQQPQVLPKSPLAAALAYVLNRWPSFCRYTEAGYLAIDNNVAERALRHVVTGRKNWLFAGSDTGGRTAAVLFSLTTTCRRVGVDAFAYLRDVLGRLPRPPRARLAELLPDVWSAASSPADVPS